jgi:glycosyltransferase involved in cell wall biosynthesis
MNVGLVSTRFAGTDGVSLESAKIAQVLARLGHDCFFCAGELGSGFPGLGAPELHFEDPVAQALGRRAFGTGEPDRHLLADIGRRAEELKPFLLDFFQGHAIDYVIVQNAFAIPMQLPLAQALAEVMVERGLPGLAHNHDLYWERERFLQNNIGEFLDTYFPPALPNLQQVTINSLAQAELVSRRGLPSTLIPNVFDFATEPPGIDAYNEDVRRAFGLAETDWLILQPTRVIPRKGIELAIELLDRLADPRAKLVISHSAGDEGGAYLRRLQDLAAQRGVSLLYEAERVSDQRGRTAQGEKVYSLWDVYPHANLVTYPSLIEGFGNALIETVYFRLPAVVNRYAVYKADIGPLGFRFVELDGAVTDEAVETVRDWLERPELTADLVAENFRLGRRYFSLETLAEILAGLLPAAA